MTKLNQTIAIEKGVKSRVYGEITEIDKAVQKPELFNGFAKQFEAKHEDDALPPESKLVQYNVSDVLRTVAARSSELFRVVAEKDFSNCEAFADIVLDGGVLMNRVPVTYLLFLEKQLTDLRTLVDRLPILDPAEKWTKDANSGLYRSEPTSTHRTKKVQKGIVLYDATDKHPAQTQLITEDVIIGFWRTTKLSGAIAKPDKMAMVERIEKLILAVKKAREAANDIDTVPVPDIGAVVFNYVMEG